MKHYEKGKREDRNEKREMKTYHGWGGFKIGGNNNGSLFQQKRKAAIWLAQKELGFGGKN